MAAAAILVAEARSEAGGDGDGRRADGELAPRRMRADRGPQKASAELPQLFPIGPNINFVARTVRFCQSARRAAVTGGSRSMSALAGNAGRVHRRRQGEEQGGQ